MSAMHPRAIRTRAFTLVELLMVMLLIAILAALVLGLSTYLGGKAARSHADAEIRAIAAACESYKSEHGSYPRKSGVTEGTVSGTHQVSVPISPKLNGDPRQQVYENASIYLYGELRTYLSPRPEQLGVDPATSSSYLQDPYGNSYGYSTAAATDEDLYEQQLQSNANAPRPDFHGLNSVPFDLWSTGGLTMDPPMMNPNLVWSRWVKNW
jgi:prepilin-type N-terminal cleavage/methylation domain-containing protein